MRRFLVVAVVGVLAACGSSGGSSSSGSGAYVDAAMKSYDDASSSVKDTFSRSQARCLIQGIVDAVGVDKLKSHGVQPERPAEADLAVQVAQQGPHAGAGRGGRERDHRRQVLQLRRHRGEAGLAVGLQPVRSADQDAGALLLQRAAEGGRGEEGAGVVDPRSGRRRARRSRTRSGTSRSCSRSSATARSGRTRSRAERPPAGRRRQSTVSTRPSAWRAKRPCSRGCTGSSVGHGQPPNSVAR